MIGTSEDGSTSTSSPTGSSAKARNRATAGRPGRHRLQPLRRPRRRGRWEHAAFIARLSGEDNPDWGSRPARNGYHLPSKTSEVSPNGQYVAFMSNESLTGYDNIDANSGARDEEVFLYSREGGAGTRLRVVQPQRRAPGGLFDTQDSGEGSGPLVDRELIWGGEPIEGIDHWLAGSIPGWTPALGMGPLPVALPLRTRAGCSSTAPTRSSPRHATARRTSTSTSPKASAAARREHAKEAASR